MMVQHCPPTSPSIQAVASRFGFPPPVRVSAQQDVARRRRERSLRAQKVGDAASKQHRTRSDCLSEDGDRQRQRYIIHWIFPRAHNNMHDVVPVGILSLDPLSARIWMRVRMDCSRVICHTASRDLRETVIRSFFFQIASGLFTAHWSQF